jgi:hypothetical protein
MEVFMLIKAHTDMLPGQCHTVESLVESTSLALVNTMGTYIEEVTTVPVDAHQRYIFFMEKAMAALDELEPPNLGDVSNDGTHEWDGSNWSPMKFELDNDETKTLVDAATGYYLDTVSPNHPLSRLLPVINKARTHLGMGEIE